jgi:hypothetical protein
MNTSNIKNPNHTYDTSGVYVVKLVVSNRFGCQDSLTKITRVFGNPKAAFSNSEACSGNLTNFYDQSIIADTLTSYWFWNFGDPKSGKDFSYLKDPSYRYMKEGNYLVRLLVEDYNGCNDTVDSTVTVNPSPFGAFTVTDNLDGKPGRIQLNNESIGADSYNWDFGNGQSSTEENPIITYTEDGTYIIQLITDNKFHCKDTTYYKYEMLFKGLFIPNAMVPSSPYDGVRLFKPVGVNLKLYHIQVYDGWGHLLWESDKLDSQGRPLDGWDGTFKGAPMPQGTYMWKVDAVFNDNTEWTGSDIGKGKFGTSGTVTLIR